MEEFEMKIDKNGEIFANQINIYDLSSFQEHNYESYETRKLMKDMRKLSGSNKSVAVSIF